MKLWHAGIAVKNLEEAITFWQKFGYKVVDQFEKDEPAAHAAMLEDENGKGLELWQFTGDSPLNEFVGRHIAFQCKDNRKAAAEFIAHGFKEVIPYTEVSTLSYIFLQDEFGTYFELAQMK
jgi:catechol 2,3-dioxygenase-like lactoylglutathione lyase family enzyme